MSTESALEVRSGADRYAVHMGDGSLARLGEIVRGTTEANQAALLSDTTTAGLFGEAAAASLRSAGFEVLATSVPPGEASKSWEAAGEVLETFAASGLSRDGIVVALGGGVVGDLAGFCAATYMRGVPVVQVPTTLLAQVDSAIGGKTGVDLRGGKNLAGAFHAPLAVVADTACLASLPDDEWRSGLAEVAKSAVLDSEGALGALEEDVHALVTDRETAAVRRAVVMAAGLKVRVVSADERESGMRECLNYGHTLGHAIERVAGYGALTHGVAVAEGMRFAAALAERVLDAPRSWTARQDALLAALGLPPIPRGWDRRELASAMRADKKVRAGEVRFVLTAGPGDWCVRALDSATIDAALEEWLAEASGGGGQR